MSEKIYPISEIFTSPQGEGLFAGTAMTFIRFAGCSVGKPFPKERYKELPHCEFKCGGDPDIGHDKNCAYVKSANTLLPIYTEMCTTYDGRNFECDTDYRVKERLTVPEILTRVPEGVRHICLTGGEPLVHDLSLILEAAAYKGLMVHLETSGTKDASKLFQVARVRDHLSFYRESTFNRGTLWITVSPKFPLLDSMVGMADEIKLLIDEKFNIQKVPESIKLHPLVYIQPINFENAINEVNLDLTLELQKVFPHWRLSSQSHKNWGVR